MSGDDSVVDARQSSRGGVVNPNCAVCNHPFSLHKNGGECTVRVDDSWRSRWCDCHAYCAPRLVDSGVDPSDPDYLDYQEQAEWRAQK